ncbi:MAG: hypothetical protein JSW50_11450 [Candidatus Latescibacterota bacterium]|nr:MAG: hypothetical protein JSW50_11450 [Candidatus Latescibacterota bacterium]
MNRFARLILVGWSLAACAAGPVAADDVRPAYLSIENNSPDRFYVTWKNPLFNGAPLPIEPVFAEGFQRISPITKIKTPDAIVRKWVLSSDSLSLEGQTIGILGLPATTSDVLFRVKFLDGGIFRSVIRPNGPEITVPLAEADTAPAESVFHRLLRRVDSARLAVLLVVAGALWALPASRKRGVIYCSIALIAGASLGYAAGRTNVATYVGVGGLPTEAKTNRILQGLLLNVYRSFSYGQYEAVYDQMAKSVSGDLLKTVYLQSRNAMTVDEEEGRAMAFVDRLDIREIDAVSKEKDGGFSVTASWDVYGSVNHWEHIHYRCNAYKARLTLMPDEKYWKITGFDLLDEKRIM